VPVPGPDRKPTQLIDIASIAMLEKALIAGGTDASRLWESPEDWSEISSGTELQAWIAGSADALAYAIAAAASVIDFEAAVIDGWMPLSVRRRLVEAVSRAIDRIDGEGLNLPTIREGTIGIHARAMGGASLPLSERFLVGPATPTRDL
jgi:predicted NBD/HSP70 family sugar kinase